MSIQYDKQTDSLHIRLTNETGEAYEPISGNFVIYIDEINDHTEIVIEGANKFLAQALKANVNLKGNTASPPSQPVWEDIDSSMVSAFKYDDSTSILEVMFKRTGVYRYFEVPADVVAGLRDASSKGSYMRSMIIDCYTYEKVRR